MRFGIGDGDANCNVQLNEKQSLDCDGNWCGDEEDNDEKEDEDKGGDENEGKDQRERSNSSS
jgi:hypothetical protein